MHQDTQALHDPGLVYFWALNDRLERPQLQAMIDAFAAARVGAVCLHPRSGMDLPYGGTDWFDCIAWIVERCREAKLTVWLYDEDPYPSGAAGGRLLMDHPQYTLHVIERDEAAADLKPGDHFLFKPGKLLWCGFLDDRGRGVVDLTARVGVLRHEWMVLPQWDSRYYYPQTPLYACARAWSCNPQLALRIPEGGAGRPLVAFTARPLMHNPSQCHWPSKVDPLNPEATATFLSMVHERYRQTVGGDFGKLITAMFTDEPKWHSDRPYTAGMLEDYQRRFGEALGPNLNCLFNNDDHAAAMLTRLRYRQWCGDRFREAWVEPVARWCEDHRLAMVGHISPEDDPIQQANCVGNLLPQMRSFTLPGIDLIIPAVGDADHPLINLGVVSATSVRAQAQKPGVLSESLACSGDDFTAAQAQRILAWQTVMGVSTVVVHCAYQSNEGHRAIDAPPDFGPLSPRWQGMADVAAALVEPQRVVRHGRQVAPVAILWPIRSFMAHNFDWQRDELNLRRDLALLLLRCLERQVGVHFLDETELHAATIEAGRLHVGSARYSHVLVPSALFWHQDTRRMLSRFMDAGGNVTGAGRPATALHTDAAMEPAASWPWRQLDIDDAARQMPRLVELNDAPDIRCSAWHRDDRVTLLTTTVAAAGSRVTLLGREHAIAPGQIVITELEPIPAAATLRA